MSKDFKIHKNKAQNSFEVYMNLSDLKVFPFYYKSLVESSKLDQSS